MRFPRLQEVSRYREMTTVFGGYNHQISCVEGEFFDMKNMTSNHFPVLSPRNQRGIGKRFENPQGIIVKDSMWWIDNKELYKNGVKQELTGVTLTDATPKALAKMGAYIIIMPDKVWCKVDDDKSKIECGYMERKTVFDYGTSVSFSVCKEDGKVISWQNEEYYKTTEPKDGDYMMSVNTKGTPTLQVYSASTSMWSTVASTYVQIKASGIGLGFEKDDGIRVTSSTNDGSLGDIFINKNEDGLDYYTDTYIMDKDDNSITIPGIYKGQTDAFENIKLIVERRVPDMAFITECNNRLWGCSKDGHEIYCCKLGDVKNWNLFRGNSTDSWAATIGSDGKFTGAITYLGYPMFFKEDGFVKIGISSVGAHQAKETKCRGVQFGSERSLAVMNEVLYYKSTSGVCAYNGSLPYSISDAFGDVKYYNAVAGVLGNKYYISMCDFNGEYSMFAYDSRNGIWCKEDDTEAVMFCTYKEDLYYIDGKDNTLKSVGGSVLYDANEMGKENPFEWYVESGPIGYSSPDNKYVGRINLRITLDLGTDVGFFLQYDSTGEWEHKFSMSGTGTRTYSIPIIPKRCDHFRYKIAGRGGCKIHSVTKTIEEGSDGL